MMCTCRLLRLLSLLTGLLCYRVPLGFPADGRGRGRNPEAAERQPRRATRPADDEFRMLGDLLAPAQLGDARADREVEGAVSPCHGVARRVQLEQRHRADVPPLGIDTAEPEEGA